MPEVLEVPNEVQTEQTLLTQVLDELRNCKTLDELLAVDTACESAEDVISAPEYRATFDEVEARLKAPATTIQITVEQALPDDVEQLKAIIRNLQVQAPTNKVSTEIRIREGVSYTVNPKAVMPQKMPPQQAAIHRAIIGAGKVSLTEAEVKSLCDTARQTGALGGKQEPTHIFRYYFGIKDDGFRARGFLTKVG